MVDSSESCEVFDEAIILFISSVHLLYLSAGREINKFLVLISHPRAIFTSSKVPSAFNFFAEMMSTLGISSELSTGQDMEWMARGIARITLVVLSPMSGVIAILLSMNTSTFPRSFVGISTESSRAGVKGMLSGRLMGFGIESDSSS